MTEFIFTECNSWCVCPSIPKKVGQWENFKGKTTTEMEVFLSSTLEFTMGQNSLWSLFWKLKNPAWLFSFSESLAKIFFFKSLEHTYFISNPLCFVSKCHSDNFPPINLVQNKNESARKTGWFIVLYSCAHRIRAVGRSENPGRGQVIIWWVPPVWVGLTNLTKSGASRRRGPPVPPAPTAMRITMPECAPCFALFVISHVEFLLPVWKLLSCYTRTIV